MPPAHPSVICLGLVSKRAKGTSPASRAPHPDSPRTSAQPPAPTGGGEILVHEYYNANSLPGPRGGPRYYNEHINYATTNTTTGTARLAGCRPTCLRAVRRMQPMGCAVVPLVTRVFQPLAGSFQRPSGCWVLRSRRPPAVRDHKQARSAA